MNDLPKGVQEMAAPGAAALLLAAASIVIIVLAAKKRQWRWVFAMAALLVNIGLSVWLNLQLGLDLLVLPMMSVTAFLLIMFAGLYDGWPMPNGPLFQWAKLQPQPDVPGPGDADQASSPPDQV